MIVRIFFYYSTVAYLIAASQTDFILNPADAAIKRNQFEPIRGLVKAQLYIQLALLHSFKSRLNPIKAFVYAQKLFINVIKAIFNAIN